MLKIKTRIRDKSGKIETVCKIPVSYDVVKPEEIP